MGRARIDGAEVVRLYRDEGATMLECATRLGCSISYVHRVLHEAGVPTREPGSGRRGKGRGRWKRKDGYILVYDPSRVGEKDPYVLEHRLVMERYLGRRLRPGETVHHVSEDRADNAISNLALFVSNSAHSSMHAKERWARRRSGR